jgi:hypothetical protein
MSVTASGVAYVDFAVPRAAVTVTVGSFALVESLVESDWASPIEGERMTETTNSVFFMTRKVNTGKTKRARTEVRARCYR